MDKHRVPSSLNGITMMMEYPNRTLLAIDVCICSIRQRPHELSALSSDRHQVYQALRPPSRFLGLSPQTDFIQYVHCPPQYERFLLIGHRSCYDLLKTAIYSRLFPSQTFQHVQRRQPNGMKNAAEIKIKIHEIHSVVQASIHRASQRTTQHIWCDSTNMSLVHACVRSIRLVSVCKRMECACVCCLRSSFSHWFDTLLVVIYSSIVRSSAAFADSTKSGCDSVVFELDIFELWSEL